MTRAETLEIQRQLGLKADGIYGPKTAAAYQRWLERLQCSIYGPPALKTPIKRAFANTEVSRPFRDSHFEAIVGYKVGVFIVSVCSTVVRLFRWRSPPAVFRRVIPIVVYSVNRCPCRLVPHVRVEAIKGVAPSLADRNTPSAIARVVSLVGVCASLNDVLPGSMLPRIKQSVRHVGAQTTTRMSLWSFHIVSSTSKYLAAITNTHPDGGPSDDRNGSYGHRTAKYLTAEILGAIGKWYHLRSHFGTSNIELARWARAFTPRLPSIIPATERGCLA